MMLDSAELTGSLDLLSNNAPQRFLERLARARNVLPQSIVDQSLVVTAARLLDLDAEPGDHVFIQADSQPHFPNVNRNYRRAFRLRKVVLTLHLIPRTSGVRAPSPSVLKSDARFRRAKREPQPIPGPWHPSPSSPSAPLHPQWVA